MAFEVLWEAPSGALKKFSGYITGDELVRSVSAIYGDPRFDDLRYVINDFVDIEGFSVTEDNVTYIAAVDGAAARTNPNIKVALVVVDAQASDMAMRYAASPWTVYPTRIFSSVEDARAWVSAPDQPASRP